MQQSSSRFNKVVQAAVVSALAVGVVGCATIGPDYSTPDAPLAAAWSRPEASPAATDAAVESLSSWWQAYGDPTLDRLVERALEDSPTLRAAALRVLEARARRGIAVGGLFPQSQNATAGYGRTELSENRANRGGGNLNFDDFEVGFDAAWELDVWGAFRRSIEAADADVLAEIAGYDDVLVALLAEVATNYVAYRTTEQRMGFARANVAIQARSLEITEARFRNGTVTELDVAQAKSLLRDTQALIPGFEATLAQTRYTLELLVGATPGSLREELGQKASIPAVDASVAVGLPADLLRRRPDVRRAERRLAAQSARIGVAKADLFPHFSLVGSIALGAEDASDLFKGDAVEAFGGPSFRWAILNYGRIANNVRVQDARYQALIADYENRVLRAQAEVEGAIAAYVGAQRQTALLGESAASATRAVEIVNLQYREGQVDYVRVLNAQQFLASEEDRLASTRGQAALSSVALYKALGGGWESRQGAPLLDEATRLEMTERSNWGGLLDDDAESTARSSLERRRVPLRRPDW